MILFRLLTKILIYLNLLYNTVLTKDRVPVVYHDFELDITMKEEIDGQDRLTVGVHQLTWRKLSRAITEFKPTSPPLKLAKLIKRHFDSILQLTKNGQKLLNLKKKRNLSKNKWGNRTPKLAAVLESIPTLQSLFYSVPQWVGFNIEIKYPIEDRHKHLRSLDVYECNTYIDIILKCVLKHGSNRRIIFSCFDPDICLLLHSKQARYPVLFLTTSGTDSNYTDYTCLTLNSAISFAYSNHLQGIVAESTPILTNTSIVSNIKKKKLVLFTWGALNTELMNVITQKKLGVDGIISDNISDLTRMQGKAHNIYRDDLLLANVPELLPRDLKNIAAFNEFRENYRSFRVGKAKGSKGELSQFALRDRVSSTNSPPRSPASNKKILKIRSAKVKKTKKKIENFKK